MYILSPCIDWDVYKVKKSGKRLKPPGSQSLCLRAWFNSYTTHCFFSQIVIHFSFPAVGLQYVSVEESYTFNIIPTTVKT